MAVRFTPKQGTSGVDFNPAIRFTPKEPQKGLLQRGFEAVRETPQRIAPVLPTAGAVGMSMATPGVLKGAGMGAVGQLAGEQLKSELQQSPMRGLSRLSPVAGAGLLVAPQVQAKVSPQAIPEAAKQAAIGALTGAAVKGVTGLAKGIGRATIGKAPFTKSVRKALIGLKSRAGDAFEAGLDKVQKANPNARVDLVDEIRNLKLNVSGDPLSNLEGNPELLAIIRRGSKKTGNNFMLNLLDKPDLAKNLTLDQARSVRRAIEAAPDIANNYAKGASANWTGAQLDALDLVADVKGKTLASFPELAAENKKWAEFAQKWSKIKPYMREGRLGPALTGRAGMFEPEIYEAATKPLLKEAGMLPAVRGMRAVSGAGRILRNPLFLGAAGGATGFGLLRGRRR